METPSPHRCEGSFIIGWWSVDVYFGVKRLNGRPSSGRGGSDVVAEDDSQIVTVVPRWQVEAEDGTNRFRVRRIDLEHIED